MDQYTINRYIETTLASVGILINLPVIVYMAKKSGFRPLSILLFNIFINNLIFSATKFIYWYYIFGLERTSMAYKISYVLVMKIMGQSIMWVVGLSTLAVAVQRWIATRRPLKSLHYITKRKTILSIVGIYAVAYIISGAFTALVLTKHARIFQKVQTVGFFPCACMVVIYSDIAVAMTCQQTLAGTKQSTKKTSIVCLVYTLVYLASYVPFLVNDAFKLGVTKYVIHLFWLDSYVNPLICAGMEWRRNAKKRAKLRNASARTTTSSQTTRSTRLQSDASHQQTRLLSESK